MIQVKIEADSINPKGNRLTTFVCTYPRFIHSEVMTHRMFSRNAASSRAIPIGRSMDAVMAKPAAPIRWGANRPGMQAGAEVEEIDESKVQWNDAMERAHLSCSWLAGKGLHKSIVNRVLEPFMHMTTIISATEFSNFFKQRAYPDAQPEFQILVHAMLNLYVRFGPQEVDWDQWHIPFREHTEAGMDLKTKLMLSTAHCARVSYMSHDKRSDPEKDIEIHDQMVQQGHWSPFEHCAKASEVYKGGNFKGWEQYRTQFAGNKGEGTNYLQLIEDAPKWVDDIFEGIAKYGGGKEVAIDY
jgi:hypothetical protein